VALSSAAGHCVTLAESGELSVELLCSVERWCFVEQRGDLSLADLVRRSPSAQDDEDETHN